MERWGAGVLAVMVAAALAGCVERHARPAIDGQDVRLTIVHTTDMHGRMLPYDMTVMAGDQDMGLLQENGPFGGITRVAHVIKRERARADRSMYLDSGDWFQGAPIFNAFEGEVEQRALSLLRPDAVVIGNHEFDNGLTNLRTQLYHWATHPLLAANYLFEPGESLGELIRPVEIVNIDGLVVGIIGVGSFTSITSITDIGNSIHLIPVEQTSIVQDWIDILEPTVDLVVAVSHAGPTIDEELIRNTHGLDVVLGGHLHVVLNPPKVIPDQAGRKVVLVHSGAFTKFVGRLDLVVHDGDVVAHDYEIIPIDTHVSQDPEMADLIEPYRLALHQLIDLDSVYGYASRIIGRFGFDGGDSPLGNLVAEAIRQYARADFGMTNSLGIRTDISPGVVSLDQLYNVFPFNNYVTTMYLSGADVQALFDYVTERSAGRGCNTQVQVSGVRFVMDCRTAPADCTQDCPPRAADIVFTNCGDPTITDKDGCQEVPLDPNGVYEMATNDYIAKGGSGFTVLKINNTQVETDVALRDAVLETIIRSPRCAEECRTPTGSLRLERCIGFEACVSDLSDFYAGRCHRAAETTPGEAVWRAHCPVDVGATCAKSTDCAVLEPCTPLTCEICVPGIETCGDGLGCVEGYCRPEGLACISKRCERACESDADCPEPEVPLAVGQRLCIDGVCRPRQGAPCADDAGCMDPELACSGACLPCEADDECLFGEVCARGSCVTPVATCSDHRCRLRCRGDGDCLSGERCTTEGLCMPTRCTPMVDHEADCRLSGEWRALERCLAVPCPTAEADGRISRILPANLEELIDDIDPEEEWE